jgi:hypothetical protein
MSTEEALTRMQIRDRLARYNIAGDANDMAAFVANFTADAVFESAAFRFEGRDGIETFFKNRPHAKPGMALFRRHNLTTCQIDLTGPTTAHARTYFFVSTDIGPDHAGIYEDDLRLENGAWLIAHRRIAMDWIHPDSRVLPRRKKAKADETP